MKSEKSGAVDAYIAAQTPAAQAALEAVRATIRRAAPEAEERISYQMPTYFLGGVLVHFAAWKKHIGLYPGASATVAFKEELSPFAGAKGSVQFPLSEPMPLDLIAKIVAFRLEANTQKALLKRSARRASPSKPLAIKAAKGAPKG